jgi:nucleoside-diphosphate-sugar epimerase
VTRTLVTGAAGFTGRYMTTLLAESGHEVHGVVHHAPEAAVAGASAMHIADLSDYRAISRVVSEVRPDHVVHLAAITFVGHDDVEEMYRANVVGTRHLLEALTQSGTQLTSIVLASSANVYGNARQGILDETTPPAPANDYGVSKLASEYVAQLYAERLPLITVRPFNYTGRHQSENFLIPKIVAHARRREATIQLGNLDVARDFSDVRTVVAAYAKLLDTPKAIGTTFNICSGRAVSLGDILEMVSGMTGHQFGIRINSELVRKNEVRMLAGSAARLGNVIGDLRPIPLEQTLRWMLDA